MKKALLFLFIIVVLASCGPRRMKCGPGRRCLVDVPKEMLIINTTIS